MAMPNPQVVSREEWLKARKALLAKERALSRQRDELARHRRELPSVRIEKDYVFEGPDGRASLADLFGARSQLIVYHFMFGPGWAQGCPSCSYLSDHVDGALPHLAARDVSFVAVSRAPLAQLQAFQQRMGWRFRWVSSHGNDFNYDFHVSSTAEERVRGRMSYNYGEMEFSGEELPGASAFYKDAQGSVFHTYSSYARGLDLMIGAYNWLDIAPKGRDEDGLKHTMSWVRHHDKYDETQHR
ncbi:MAG: DUF899 domain-containing protein [Pseudomonadota bacterium]|nr:DUF899 domain-containing protein [Pseudomonadota bacterium]